MAVLLVWWAVALVGLLLLVAGGPWILVLPVGVVGVLVVANTVVLVRHTGPEEDALEAGALRRADADRDGVAVPARRGARRWGSDRQQRAGTLAYQGGRLSFTVEPRTSAPAGGESVGDDPLAGMTVLDAAPRELVLGARPSWRRPALVVSHDGTVHVLDLSPPSDLGAGAVGAVVAGAWWDQLHELGAPTATS